MENDPEIERQLRAAIPFLQDYVMTRDLRGHSRALCYVLTSAKSRHCTSKPARGPKDMNQDAKDVDRAAKYFTKIYTGDRVDSLKYIESVYNLLEIPTAQIVKIGYLKNSDQTFCIYEFITGPTFGEILTELSAAEIEATGRKIGAQISKFAKIKGEPEKFQRAFDQELVELLANTRAQQQNYNQTHTEPLPEIDLNRLENSLQNLKSAIYATEPTFVHSDINLNNIILHDGAPVLIDTEGGKIKFRALDFRGNCWWGWSGENVEREQAAYRGIYRGLFNDQIPASFHQELSFTMIYEFLLRNQRYAGDAEQIHYSFMRWHDNLEQTNYFENYKFSWF